MEFGAGPPSTIGVYTVERELGAGGMGTVYLARSRGGRPVAVKVARPELAADPHFRERFRAEVDAARRVGGFHTASVVDADPDAQAPWLATAYIPGPTLAGLLAERGPMDESRLRLLGAALAEALQAIHACGLVHRDLKPGNIIMAEDGPRVLDFGIARAVESTRLTSTGGAFGTPGFLAPEQAQGLEVDGGADVFALGAVLTAAAGGTAFGMGTPMGMMYRSVHEPADLSAVPQGLRTVIAACLSKDPARRPTPAELLDLLAPGSTPHPPTLAGDRLHSEAVTIDSPGQGVRHTGEESRSARPEPARRSRKQALSVALVATVVVGALAGGAFMLAQKNDRSGDPSVAAPGSGHASSAAGTPPASVSPSTQTPPTTAEPKPAGKVTVVVSNKGQESWISAKGSDGRLLFGALLPPGVAKTFTDKERIDLVLSDAGAVQLVVNGRSIQRSPQPGQVERLTYTKDD